MKREHSRAPGEQEGTERRLKLRRLLCGVGASIFALGAVAAVSALLFRGNDNMPPAVETKTHAVSAVHNDTAVTSDTSGVFFADDYIGTWVCGKAYPHTRVDGGKGEYYETRYEYKLNFTRRADNSIYIDLCYFDEAVGSESSVIGGATAARLTAENRATVDVYSESLQTYGTLNIEFTSSSITVAYEGDTDIIGIPDATLVFENRIHQGEGDGGEETTEERRAQTEHETKAETEAETIAPQSSGTEDGAEQTQPVKAEYIEIERTVIYLVNSQNGRDGYLSIYAHASSGNLTMSYDSYDSARTLRRLGTDSNSEQTMDMHCEDTSTMVSDRDRCVANRPYAFHSDCTVCMNGDEYGETCDFCFKSEPWLPVDLVAGESNIYSGDAYLTERRADSREYKCRPVHRTLTFDKEYYTLTIDGEEIIFDRDDVYEFDDTDGGRGG